MQKISDMYNRLNKPSVNSKYLFDSNSFASLISPKGKIDNIFFNNLISEWQKQTNLYVNSDNPDSPKMKIDKLIADGKLAQYILIFKF